LAQDTNGNVYGVTATGGTTQNGTIFKITPAGLVTNFYSFTGTNDGAAPLGGLLAGADGNLDGTTQYGGTSNYGTVFRITPDGVLTNLHSFDGTNGGLPEARLAQATDGDFYGTTAGGGGVIKDAYPAIFRLRPAGDYSVIFPTNQSTVGSEGTFSGQLTPGMDGNLYGTTGEAPLTVAVRFSRLARTAHSLICIPF
jgi:uncharacterized repeat protein (TIGR03803 family)